MSGLILTRRMATTTRPNALGVFARALVQAFRVASTRQDLAGMDDRMLRDIGITRIDALREAARKPWDQTPTRRD
ncbi:MAG: DUF1127 domain-containing protein [Pseudomonadota bacterium]